MLLLLSSGPQCSAFHEIEYVINYEVQAAKLTFVKKIPLICTKIAIILEKRQLKWNGWKIDLTKKITFLSCSSCLVLLAETVNNCKE
jgi:hypothetical protein